MADEAEVIQYVHQSQVKEVFQSKWELHSFLSGDGEAYLPDLANVQM